MTSEDTRLFFPAKERQKCAQPNYEYFDVKRRSIRHYRIQYLYDEYRQACERAGERPYTLSTFKTGLCAWRRKSIESQTPLWFPGEYLQCYWTRFDIGGDPSNPAVRCFFVARLPYSEYAYIRAVEDTSCQTWMRMCIQAYRFFGGVPYVTECYVAFENTKSSAKRRPPSALATMQAFAAHYRTVLRRPCPKTEKTANARLKPLALKRQSRAIQFIKTNLNVFKDAGIEELNERIAPLVYQANSMSVSGRPSARETFELYEASQLLALPEEDYDMAMWTERVVGSDYHFNYKRTSFSVPFTYAYETIRVRISEDFVEAYSMGKLIARHLIPDKGKGRCLCTDPSHRPHGHKVFSERLTDRFMRLALEVGPATGAIMKETLALCQKKGVYRRCKDLIDLKHTPSGISLEEACTLVLERDMELSAESAARIMRENTR